LTFTNPKETIMPAKYRVTLNADEINEINQITRKGVCASRTTLFARALALLDQGEFAQSGWTVAQVATAVGCTSRTLEHLKERFVNHGLEAALERKKPVKPPREVVFDGEFAARLTQLACSKAPDGRSRWTVRLLAEKMVELRIVPAVSAMTVHNTLKKTRFNLTAADTGRFRRTRTRSS
jgi:hypothetical protein